MRIAIILALIISSVPFSFGQKRINLVILRNGKLIESGPGNVRLNDHYVDYWPGELIVKDSVYSLIVQDSILNLEFDFYIHKKRNTNVRNFECKILDTNSDIPYQVLEVFDFIDPSYKKWYSHHTNRDFLCELRFPNSGIYIPKGAKIKN